MHHRLIVYPKDLQNIFGCPTYQAALQKKRRILLKLGKKTTDKLTVDMLCEAESLQKTDVIPYLK